MISNFFFLDLITTIVTLTVVYYVWTYMYWKKNNVPLLIPHFSSHRFIRKENFGFKFKYFHDDIKSKGWKHGSVLVVQRPFYMPVDLELVKNILTRDFEHFVDRIVYHNEKYDPVSLNLFSLSGHRWRTLRAKLTPTFTSGKMKMMFETLLNCTANLLEQLELHEKRNEPIDIKEHLGHFTTDVIGSCAFGLECDSFKEKNSPFRVYGQKFFTVTLSKILRLSFAFVLPKVAQYLGIVFTPKDLTKFFTKLIKDNVKYREAENYRRKDFMQLLIDLKNDEECVTMNEIIAQCFVFFTAGFEASATSMTFTLYELVRNPEIQDKVRTEIISVLAKYGGEITYEAIRDMKYMDQVVSETLRLYPPVPFLTRKCIKDYKFPDENAFIKKNTCVIISVLGIHHDERYYPDPEKFDPERFSQEKKDTRHRYAYIPFGEGPRICIGVRFGLMQIKAGLAVLLKNYKFTLNEKTKVPIKTRLQSLGLAIDGGLWLNVQKV